MAYTLAKIILAAIPECGIALCVEQPTSTHLIRDFQESGSSINQMG
jgi:hypothetical protein